MPKMQSLMNSQQDDQVDKTVLDNGLKVLTERVKSVKSISVGVWVKTGSRNEPGDKAGITHFLEHMLFKGTETRTAYDIALSMESVGGYMNAFTSNEYTCYYIRSLDSELERAMEVLSDMVLNSTFPDEEVEKEKKVVIEEMKMYRDSPEDYLFESFTSKIFRSHPLGRPVIGYEETVRQLDRSDLFDYVERRYQPWNIQIAVAGNADHQNVVSLAEKYLGSPSRKDQNSSSYKLTPYEIHRETLTKPIEQTHMMIGRRGLWFDHPDKYLLLLANTILGGGMSSRLHQHIREQYGYCYSIGTFNQTYVDTGLFGIYIGTDRNYIEHVRELIVKEFEALRNQPIEKKELEEAKSQLKGKLLLSQEAMSSRMMRLAKSELYFERFITLEELVEKIEEVEAEQIREFSHQFFQEENFSESLLLPENATEPEKSQTI